MPPPKGHYKVIKTKGGGAIIWKSHTWTCGFFDTWHFKLKFKGINLHPNHNELHRYIGPYTDI